MNRAQDILRIKSLRAALSWAVREGLTGFDHQDQSAYQTYQGFDPQEQRERDLLELGDEDVSDPAYKDWCQPARLQGEFGNPNAGVNHLQEIHDDQSKDSIEKTIHAAIYRTESQEWNHHDRVLVDVPKDGRRKGGTHGVAPEKRRKRSAKVVNEQLLRWNASATECREADVFNAAVSERINRKREYALSQYHGKYREVLSFFILGLPIKEIAVRVGKTQRRIRQIINGNAGRSAPGLRQFITDLCEPSPPLPDINDACTAPIVAGVGVRHVC